MSEFDHSKNNVYKSTGIEICARVRPINNNRRRHQLLVSGSDLPELDQSIKIENDI